MGADGGSGDGGVDFYAAAVFMIMLIAFFLSQGCQVW